MKSERQFSFEISGEIFRTESKQDNYYDDKELLSILNEKEHYIRKKIEEELYNYSREFGKISTIEVQLRFERGSILATGWVIVGFLGGIAGAISFFEYFNRLTNYIRSVTQRVISRNLPGSYRVAINVTPTSYPLPTTNDTNDNKSFDLFKISPSNLLLSITLINIVFFLGGTLFNAFQVQSIQQKYDEANAKILEAKVKIDSATQMLNTAKIDYQLKQQEIENIKSEVFAKRNQIISSLSSDTVKIKSEVINVDTKLSILSNQIVALNSDAEKYGKSLKEMSETISNLHDRKITFGFTDIWGFMNVYLKIIVCAIFTVSLLTIVVFAIRLFEKLA
jgi:hypothetical protein